MSELSREQVEALGACSERWWKHRSGSVTLGEHLAPTVAAMLDQARAEGAAAVAADVEAVLPTLEHFDGAVMSNERYGEGWLDGMASAAGYVRTALARRAPSAAPERPMSDVEGSGGTTGPPASERPSDRRTGPRPFVIEKPLTPVHIPPGPECGEPHGRMVCQLRRGHDGAHEDLRDVEQERRA